MTGGSDPTVWSAGEQAAAIRSRRLSSEELLDLLDKLVDPPADLVRKDGFFKDQGLIEGDYTDPKAVAELLDQYPRLMQRPVIVKGDLAIIGRPKDRVATFLQS